MAASAFTSLDLTIEPALAHGGVDAALVDLPDGPAGAGRLLWFVEPRILRTLAGHAA